MRDADRPKIVSRLKRQIIEHTLPLWSRQGWDSQRGGFVDRLGADGEPDREAPRRLRVQARQIHCFAKAAQLGWLPEGKAIALDGLEYMLAKAKSPDGRPGYVSFLEPDGSMQSAVRDTYDQAFVLLALATVYELDQDPQIRTEIDGLMEFLDTELKSEHGGYQEGIPAILPRRQNPHMHMFEAMLALFDATRDLAFQSKAGDLFRLFATRFYDSETESLDEYFEDDWSRILPSTVEPGHLAEWVWLLKNFERLTGCPTAKYRKALLRSALRYRHEATGCLVDEVRPDGQIAKFSQRCWPQTELVKAFLAQAESGEAKAANAAQEALERLEKRYLRHPVKGGWYEHFDGNGHSIVDWIPASSLYHIFGAITEADRILTPSRYTSPEA